jgi:hypothetical protein
LYQAPYIRKKILTVYTLHSLQFTLQFTQIIVEKKISRKYSPQDQSAKLKLTNTLAALGLTNKHHVLCRDISGKAHFAIGSQHFSAHEQ